ncbi:MAG: sugar ABC transporter ATP-binding protein [Bacillota bacterium]|uniref:ATP-binding cassette domain-containing protein n=1 Tax=Thermanaerosceptrum fracticalcis TaxID=1712410 RepID=A0A7G6E5F0_THEFR|nr:sugar ABC transporter ATP-binding protein [Thermanaerosceptrum fracticalcis]QNB47304.1 ATP-binding cassette domain-containing protein [Thermanaerosceptrum fracticalcis]
MPRPLLQMKGIAKSFPGVKALDDVELELQEGEVLALLGENGAGKSSLMKILSGVYQADQGMIKISDQEVKITSPKDAQYLGIATIHQELNLIPQLSVAENIFLGREFTNKFGTIDWRKMAEEAGKILAELDLNISAQALVGDLGIAEQQMVEIAKALSLKARIIIMDEPTATLTEKETNRLFKAIKRLRSEGKSIIYISHRLEEVFMFCDRLMVLRDGRYIDSRDVDKTDIEEVIQMMVGRNLEEKYPKIQGVPQGETLAVKGLSIEKKLYDINFSLRAGEVLGVAGLVGSGRTELAKAIFGFLPITQGKILLEGKEVQINNPRTAIGKGIAYVPENRKEEGLILGLSVRENITLASLNALSYFWGSIKKKEEVNKVDDYISRFNIKTPHREQPIKNLSGGNQQKVVLAKWMLTKPKVLILDEPTRGIDVGAKVEIYQLINQLKQWGVAIMVISSELPEVLGVSDRIMVMSQGRVSGFFDSKEASQEKIMVKALGG